MEHAEIVTITRDLHLTTKNADVMHALLCRKLRRMELAPIVTRIQELRAMERYVHRMYVTIDKSCFQTVVAVIVQITQEQMLMEEEDVYLTNAKRGKNCSRPANVKTVHHMRELKIKEKDVGPIDVIEDKNYWIMENATVASNISSRILIMKKNVDLEIVMNVSELVLMPDAWTVLTMKGPRVIKGNAHQIIVIGDRSYCLMVHVKTVEIIPEPKLEESSVVQTGVIQNKNFFQMEHAIIALHTCEQVKMENNVSETNALIFKNYYMMVHAKSARLMKGLKETEHCVDLTSVAQEKSYWKMENVSYVRHIPELHLINLNAFQPNAPNLKDSYTQDYVRYVRNIKDNKVMAKDVDLIRAMIGNS